MDNFLPTRSDMPFFYAPFVPERLAAIRGTAFMPSPWLRCAPLGRWPREDLCLADETRKISLFLFLRSVESLPGANLPWQQRTGMNLGSKDKGPLFLQHRKNPGRQFARHRYNRLACGQMLGMPPVNGAIKFPQFRVLPDGRPGTLNQFTAQAAVSPTGDRPAMDAVPRRMLRGHQSQERGQLVHPVLLKILPRANPGQKVRGHNLSNPGKARQVGQTSVQLRILAAEVSQLSGDLQVLLPLKVQRLQQSIQPKPDRSRTGQRVQLSDHATAPVVALRGSLRKRNSFKQEQSLDPALTARDLPDHQIPDLGQMTQMTVGRRRHMNALELTRPQGFGDLLAVQPIRFHPLPRRRMETFSSGV